MLLRSRGLWRHDPGPCPVDDAPHTTCTAPPGPIVVSQLPARDALKAPQLVAPPLRAEEIQTTLPPNQFTTGTYRGDPKRRRRR